MWLLQTLARAHLEEEELSCLMRTPVRVRLAAGVPPGLLLCLHRRVSRRPATHSSWRGRHLLMKASWSSARRILSEENLATPLQVQILFVLVFAQRLEHLRARG